MDLSQTKLTKKEWDSIEMPISDEEKKVLQLIMDGFHNTQIRTNHNQSILNHLKIDFSEEMEYYLFKTQFEPEILSFITPPPPARSNEITTSSSKKKSGSSASVATHSFSLCAPNDNYVRPIQQWLQTIKKKKTKTPNSKDMIRIQNTASTIQHNKHTIFEFVLLDFVKGLVYPSSTAEKEKDGYYAYSLIQFQKSSISKINKYVCELVNIVLDVYQPSRKEAIENVFYNASSYIEGNLHLIKYEDNVLYSHQEKLFQLFQNQNQKGEEGKVPKLVMYMAPTGTGKTLSPVGLSQGYRIIFVCVARHVGLALAKSAISVNKRVAFAFGCSTASDVRLHYFSAVDYKINKRSGGIGKVDNSNGSKVEIMICDVASYITAMYYMLAFHTEEEIITYWDEPTITMDYDTHELHSTIHNNWKNNKISKMVLSCATLPKHYEIKSVIEDFKYKFAKKRYTEEDFGEDEDEDDEALSSQRPPLDEDNYIIPKLCIIESYDCKKSISLLNKDGKAMLPHLLFREYSDLLDCIRQCETNKTLLRYFDVSEVVKFVKYVCEKGYVGEAMLLEKKFNSISQINMRSLKNHYLEVLNHLDYSHWNEIYVFFQSQLKSKLFLKKENLLPSRTGNEKEHLRKIQSLDVPPSSSSQNNGAIKRTNSTSLYETPPYLYTSGVLVSTSDAYTLTDGPTIFLADDVDKIGTFYIQQSKIPETVLQGIHAKIEKNNEIQKMLELLQKEMDDKTAKSGSATPSGSGGKEKSKKEERDPALNKEVERLMDRYDSLKTQIENIQLNPKYVPNTSFHQDIWIHAGYERPRNAFVPSIDQDDVKEIMALNVDNQKKLLLLLGIGVFDMNLNTQYVETIKSFAHQKKLFLVIATSDYIYGTNYQFSHGFIGKDLQNMTRQKIIQSIGRIGRNNIQQDYTVRFRDNEILEKLFRSASENENKEAKNMCALFSS